MFEFEFQLDNIDLNYIWQNTAPRKYEKMTTDVKSIADNLDLTERLSPDDLMNENLRWMVFKVKQRSQADYKGLLARQAGQSDKAEMTLLGSNYKVQFNWPYDYFSFIELIKLDAEVLYNVDEGLTEELGVDIGEDIL